MPIYVFKCDKCGEVQEVERSIKDSDKAPDLCECGNTLFKKCYMPSLITGKLSKGYYNNQVSLKPKKGVDI
jgi:putative FmdB family regulatory protein